MSKVYTMKYGPISKPAPEFHSYSVQLVGPAPDFNGDAGIEFRVILGTSDTAQEMEDILIAVLEKELWKK